MKFVFFTQKSKIGFKIPITVHPFTEEETTLTTRVV